MCGGGAKGCHSRFHSNRGQRSQNQAPPQQPLNTENGPRGPRQRDRFPPSNQQQAVPVHFGVDGILPPSGYNDTTRDVVSFVPHIVYFLKDEETIAKFPSMLPLLLGSVKSPRIPMDIEG